MNSPGGHWTGFWIALAAVAALAAGCAGPARSPSASPSPSLPKTTLTTCIVEGLYADCGNVWVPQDWAHPDRLAMPLRVVVLPATGTTHPAAPLFYLAGTGGTAVGDGDAVLNGMTWAAQVFRPLNQTMDLVFVEQRGTPGSGLQTCPGLPAALHAFARGQWAAGIARLGLTSAIPPAGTTALQGVTIGCTDTWDAMNPATISQQGPSVFIPEVTVVAEGMHALCASWPHDPGASGVVRSTVPVVFLNGTADPGDPPANVAGATATMPNALLVPVPGIAHFTLGWNPHPGCLLAATTAFIQAGRPASPAAWAACTRALAAEPVPFPAP